MKNKKKMPSNILKFSKNLNKLERQVEAILFAADEPLDIETIEKRVQSTKNIKKILINLQSDYSLRGFNLSPLIEIPVIFFSFAINQSGFG